MPEPMDDHETPVVFRKDSGGITAVFPTLLADPTTRYMACYSHVGQHHSCAIGWYMTTKPASFEEYAELFAELESLGYRLKPYRKIQRWMDDARQSERGKRHG